MAETTIEWCDFTHNHWEGCTPVSPACDHCYAEVRNARYGGGIAPNWGVGAPRRLTSQENRKKPLRYNRRLFGECASCRWRGFVSAATSFDAHAKCAECNAVGSIVRTRARVFCSSLSDVFDNEVDPSWRTDLWQLVDSTPTLEWMLLTKRIGNVRKMVPRSWLEPNGWPKNVRLGITVSTQEEVERDVPRLLDINAPNFLSIEPILGAIDLLKIREKSGLVFNALSSKVGISYRGRRIDWVIAGGESGGPDVRPAHIDWLRQLRDQCGRTNTEFLLKQWGAYSPGSQFIYDQKTISVDLNGRVAKGLTAESYPSRASSADGWTLMRHVGKKKAGRELDGVIHDGRPGPKAMPLPSAGEVI
ncbi:DUF5131 family protein [Burkholderia sp. Ac-20365]|nr:DUF5131 family protein [Burkholderia sp. Ac-20365]MBN3761366.1 DUF5131 family protein [Burkholderia sp. Ac-20365]